MTMPDVYPIALIAALYLAFSGYRKGSLSSSGSVAAFIIGYFTLASPVISFGITLLSFYLLGSRATKIGHERKGRLEREYIGESKSRSPSHKAASGGQRNWIQVCCNGLFGAITSLAFRILYAHNWQNGYAWCLLRSSRPVPATFWGIEVYHHQTPSIVPRTLFLMMLGHFACCMGDTLASETGILARKHPRLILPPFRQVPPGTNGGLSVQGTLGSLIGGALMGLVSGFSLLSFDNPACQHIATNRPLLAIISIGALAGVGGSAIDSLLGATLQRTWWNRASKQVLLGRLPKEASPEEWQVITGRDILSNNSVNLLSSITTAILTAAIGGHFFA